MYFTQIKLNPSRRDTARLISSPQRIHAAVLDGFPTLNNERILWRLDQNSRHESILYVVSPDKPDYSNFHEMYTWSRLPYSESIKSADYLNLLRKLQVGDEFGFQLKGNTVKRKNIPREGRHDQVKRISLAGEDIDNWLTSKGEECGVIFKEFSSSTELKEFYRNKNKIHLQITEFRGILEVVDPDRLRNSLVNGVGPAKAYGCGLLTLSRTA